MGREIGIIAFVILIIAFLTFFFPQILNVPNLSMYLFIVAFFIIIISLVVYLSKSQDPSREYRKRMQPWY